MTNPFYLHTGSVPIYATAHRPRRGTQKRTGILICPPLAWQEQCSHRVRRSWADLLATHGYPVLRFDLQGQATVLTVMSTAHAWMSGSMQSTRSSVVATP